jgi:hypothetical protein
MNLQSDDNPNTISDDQELAKALAGVGAETPAPETEAPVPEVEEVLETPAPLPVSFATNPVPERGNLEEVKMEAINELRPIIDKLNLPPDEKFDTYLLLIRCTDDRELVPPAHEVAKLIEDDSRRAQALLDIIKEIEYLSNKPAEEPAAPVDQFTSDLSKNLGAL